MKLEMVAPETIRPDPNQPRKSMPQRHIEELAQSFVQNGIGIINPIEVDDDNVIVTGELRWRASQLAGMKEIPIKRFQPQTDELRFFRQVHENLHQGSYADRQQMTAMDTANAMVTLIDMMDAGKLNDSIQDRNVGQTEAATVAHQKGKHYSRIAERLSCSEAYVREHVEILRGKKDKALREAVQEGKVPRTVLRSVKVVQDGKLRTRLGKRIISEAAEPNLGGGTGVGQSKVRDIGHALNRAPQYASELLDLAKAKHGDAYVEKQIKEIAPTKSDAMDASVAPGEMLITMMGEVGNRVQDAESISAFPPIMQLQVESGVLRLYSILGAFIETSPKLDAIDAKVLPSA